MEKLSARRILFLLFFLLIQFQTFSQDKKVTLILNKVNINTLFQNIKEQTGYSFFINVDNSRKIGQITLNRYNVPVSEILNEILKNTDLTYTLIENVIVIKIKDLPKPANKVYIVKGRVSDFENNDPLPGVNVRVKGGFLGTVTDFDGKFAFQSPYAPAIIIFSFVGFESQEIEYNGQDQINVKLKPQTQTLNDVVITGYQVIDKRELTSSISSVNAEELDLVGSVSVDRMLEGKATGLMISNLSSTPGAASKVRIRGGSTFTGNQSPLWVVDGVIYEDPVPLTADEINSFDNINLIGNALTGINPQDIAKIDILKDASATAIYGTRAANGVIVITTKRGKEGTPSIAYSGGYSYVQAPGYSDFNLMNSKERIDVSREMYSRNIGFSGYFENVDRLGYEGALMNLWDKTYDYQQFQDRVSYLETLNSDWFGKLYQAGISQQHSLSASGGTQNVRYYTSFGYDNQQGTEIGVGLNRITARSNIDLDLRKNLLLSFKISGSIQNASYNHNSVNIFNEAYYTSRTIPLYNDDGNYFFQSREIFSPSMSSAEDGIVYGRYNTLKELDNSARTIQNKDFSITANLNWDILRNLKLNSMFSYRNTTNLNEEWITEDSYYIAKLRTYDEFEDMVSAHLDQGTLVPFGGIYSAGLMSQDAYTFRNQLNYNLVLNSKHVFNFNLGNEIRSAKYWGATGFSVPGYNHYQGRGFIPLPPVSFDPATSQLDFSEYDYEFAFNWLTRQKGVSIYPTITDKLLNSVSMFGIANYVYDNRYVLNFNIRSDGSNAFGQYERYKFKPTWSGSLRWNIHNESFFKKGDLFEELALRASYGLRGTTPNTTPYLIITNYGRNQVVYYPEMVSQLSEFPNANLRWEKTQTLNAGLNFSLLKGRVSGAFDYAYSMSTDLIQLRPVSLVNGTSTQSYNSGAKDVSSYELSVRTINLKTREFAWSTNLNFSYDYDRVLKGFESGAQANLTVSNYLNGSIYREGFPTNGFFSYRFDGLDSNGLPTFQHLVEPNMTAEDQLKAALIYEGSRIPLYYGGFGTEFKYKNFRLSMNFTYKLGYKVRLLKLYNGNQNLPLPYENMHSDFINRWREPGDETITNIPSLSNANMLFTNSLSADGKDRIYVTNYSKVVPSGRSAWWMYDYSDARVVNGDHIRFQTVSLSYQVPSDILKKTALKNLSLSLQGSNLGALALDPRLTGQDPEQVNGIGMPSLPTYSLSINMGL